MSLCVADPDTISAHHNRSHCVKGTMLPIINFTSLEAGDRDQSCGPFASQIRTKLVLTTIVLIVLKGQCYQMLVLRQ